MTRMIATLLAGASLVGCTYDETALEHYDLKGTVTIPVAAATVQLEDIVDDTITWEISDPRALGPIYLGVYASAQDNLYDYWFPELGPVTDPSSDNSAGDDPDALPYGGTSVGRFAYGCYQNMVCNVVTGRYTDYADVLDFFANQLKRPLTNDDEDAVTAYEYQERCYEVSNYTADYEVDFIGDTYFSESGDSYVADVEILHVPFREGITVWGWMDAPSATFDFATCQSSGGPQVTYYSDDHYQGANAPDVLNFPGKYIDSGDWITSEPAVLQSPDDAFNVELGYHYVNEDE